MPEEKQRYQACHAQDSKDNCEQDLPVNVVVLDAECCDGKGEAENSVQERHEGNGEEARCDREVRVAAVGQGLNVRKIGILYTEVSQFVEQQRL